MFKVDHTLSLITKSNPKYETKSTTHNFLANNLLDKVSNFKQIFKQFHKDHIIEYELGKKLKENTFVLDLLSHEDTEQVENDDDNTEPAEKSVLLNEDKGKDINLNVNNNNKGDKISDKPSVIKSDNKGDNNNNNSVFDVQSADERTPTLARVEANNNKNGVDLKKKFVQYLDKKKDLIKSRHKIGIFKVSKILLIIIAVFFVILHCFYIFIELDDLDYLKQTHEIANTFLNRIPSFVKLFLYYRISILYGDQHFIKSYNFTSLIDEINESEKIISKFLNSDSVNIRLVKDFENKLNMDTMCNMTEFSNAIYADWYTVCVNNGINTKGITIGLSKMINYLQSFFNDFSNNPNKDKNLILSFFQKKEIIQTTVEVEVILREVFLKYKDFIIQDLKKSIEMTMNHTNIFIVAFLVQLILIILYMFAILFYKFNSLIKTLEYVDERIHIAINIK